MMSLRIPTVFNPHRRWLPLLVLVVVLHLAAIQWAFSPVRKSAGGNRAQKTVTAELQMEQAPPLAAHSVAPEPVTVAQVPKPALQEQPAAGGKGASRDAGQTDDGAGDEGLPDPAMAGIEVPGTSVEEAMPITIPPPSSSGKRAAGKDGGKPMALFVPQRYQVSSPPSAELQYKAHSRHKGQDLYGNGSIHWQSDGKKFTIRGEFNVLFLTLLNFRSEGVIDPDFGVSPVIYAEKRIRRSETNTHFQQAGKLVSFSASTKAYLRQGGEQDRASVVWQLAGIGRRDSEKFKEGAEFDLVVAGVRDAEVRTVRVLAMEEVESGVGKVKAWHLVHNRRPGSYEHTLDIWLSPERDWYPVKLRYTEKSGDYLDLVLSDIRTEGTR